MIIKLRIMGYVSVLIITFALGLQLSASAGDESLPSPEIEASYGHNEAAGHWAQVNGIKVYYETYGQGAPMLMIHGNGGKISSLRHQIKYFSTKYRVIVADSRGHGRSEIGAERLTYEQMAEDYNTLLEVLDQKQLYVLGWSDGGIISLLLAINHPDKVNKLAIMGANLEPRGAYGWASAWVAQEEKTANAMIAKGDESRPWAIYKQHLDLLGKQPNIPLAQLKKISAPTLVMAGDKDVIKPEHTQAIFDGLPKAYLCIFPGATHMIPLEDPVLFNHTVEKFFRNPYVRPDTKRYFQQPASQP